MNKIQLLDLYLKYETPFLLCLSQDLSLEPLLKQLDKAPHD